MKNIKDKEGAERDKELPGNTEPDPEEQEIEKEKQIQRLREDLPIFF